MKRVCMAILICLIVSIIFGSSCSSPNSPPTNTIVTPTQASQNIPTPSKPASTSNVVNISFSTQYAENARQHVNNQKPVLEAIEKRSNGRIKFTLFAAGALGGSNDQYDIVRSGKADMGTTSGLGYTAGRFPLSDVFTFPIAYESSIASQQVVQEVGMKALQKETVDTKILCFNQSQLFYVYTSKPIKTLEDLKGMKIRSAGGLITPALEALGAVPVTLGLNDVYLSLKTGVISGAITGPAGVQVYKLWEVANYVTMIPFGYTTQVVNFNLDSWKRIPDDLKIIIEEEAGKTGENVPKMLDDDNKLVNAELVKRGGATYTLTPQEYERWASAVKSVIDKWVVDLEAKGLPAQDLMKTVREKCKEKNVPFPY